MPKTAVLMLLACLASTGCKPVVKTDASIRRIASTWPPYQPPALSEGLETRQPSRLGRHVRPSVRPVLDRPTPAVKPYRDWDLEETALDALARIGEPAVPELTKALSDPDAHVRWLAADVLGRIGPAAEDAVPALVDTIDRDADENVKKAAVRALGQIGPDAEDAVGPLLRLIGGAAERPPSLSAGTRHP